LTIILDSILKNTSSIGWSILSTSSNPTISPEIYGVHIANKGKFLKIKDPFPDVPESWTAANCAVEWVDLSDWLNDNFELELASTEKLGGIKANAPKAASIIHYVECELGTNLIDPTESYQTEALFVNVDSIISKTKTTQGITITPSDEISIDTSSANNNDVLFFNGTNVGWKNIHEPKESGFASNIGIITMSGDG